MSEPQEGQLVESGMSAEEMAALSEPAETEGEVPETTKSYGVIRYEDVEESCKSADEQADDREEIPGIAADGDS